MMKRLANDDYRSVTMARIGTEMRTSLMHYPGGCSSSFHAF